MTDPQCVMGPGGTPCGGCHWDLRAKYGPMYWLKQPHPTKRNRKRSKGRSR